jgi:TnpA family transposase
MLSFVNRRHVNANKLNQALFDLINRYNSFSLPKLWGDGSTAAADGTKYDLYEQNLLSEYHIRYGGYGGIAYHHVADSYVALFSHFIPCGTWEAVYIIEGLLKNIFGGEGTIANNDPEEQEKIIKYNDVIANAVIFHNVVDLTNILCDLKREGSCDSFTRNP